MVKFTVKVSMAKITMIFTSWPNFVAVVSYKHKGFIKLTPSGPEDPGEPLEHEVADQRHSSLGNTHKIS